MTQKSLHWDGASVGDADTLTVNAADGIGWRLSNEDYESPFVDLALRMILNGTGNRGVLLGWANELLVAAGVGMSVDVATGGAIVYGMPYENTSVVNVAIPAPTDDTRYDYIVLRRDWDAQTIRITRIAGVEGGGAPAITQSPAPSGSGIYDIPLAIVEVTTAPAIGAVTDMREWCTFSTVPMDDGLATAQFANESADWASRATRTKQFFVGGGDLEPVTPGANQDLFSYSASSYLSDSLLVAPAWGSNVVTEEGWRSTADTFWEATLKLPADYAGGDVTVYLWWMVDGGNLGYVNPAWQAWGDGEAVVYSGTYTHVNCLSAGGNGTVEREEMIALSGLGGDEVIHYCIEADSNPQLALILGLQFVYTGYL